MTQQDLHERVARRLWLQDTNTEADCAALAQEILGIVSEEKGGLTDMARTVVGQQRSARVFYDRETAKLIVRVDASDDEPPTDFEIASVTVEIEYPDGSPNYGSRNFRR